MENQANETGYPHSSNIVESLNILVVGATGGTGRATVEKLLNEGHKVTAFSRSAHLLADGSDRLVTVNGDAANAAALDRAMCDQDVVIVTLGISENPLRVRFFGTARTPGNIRSAGTRNVIAAMRKRGVRRLVMQSSFGVGETRGLLGFIDQLFFNLVLEPQIADTEEQEKIVRDSDLDWVIAQPVHLIDKDADTFPFLSANGQARVMRVARKSVAKFLALAARETEYIGKSVAISG